MVKFLSQPYITNALKSKNYANASSENKNEYIITADLYLLAYIELLKELKKNKYSLFKALYGKIYGQYLLYEHYNCLYAYFRIHKEFDKASINLKKLLEIIVELKRNVLNLDNSIKDSNDYDLAEYEKLLINIGYDYFSSLLISVEFPAKKYFDNKDFLNAAKKYHECFYPSQKLLEYSKNNLSIIGVERYNNIKLNRFILSFNYSASLIGSFAKNTVNNDKYYVLAIIQNLLNSIEDCKEIIELKKGDRMYSDGLETMINNLNEFVGNNKNSWDIILDKYRDNNIIISAMQNFDIIYFQNTQNGLNPTPPERYVIVFMIHGFRDRGSWKLDLATLLGLYGDGVRFIPAQWDYGEFKFFRFMNKWARKRVVYEFKEFFNRRLLQIGTLGDVACVAHSFGTFICSQNIKQFPEVNFDKIIFVGSILRKDFDWIYCHIKYPNTKVRFETHKGDGALRFAYLYSKIPWVSWLGDTGRKGFNNEFTFIEEFNNEYGDHSDMFGELHMRNNWIPFLAR